MIELTFSKSGREDIVLTEDDLFDFRFERGCFSGDTFELGGVSAKSIYMIIDNNTQRFPRGAFANCRVRLDIDGHFCGYFNSELPKRRNGVIELTVYDDMIKLDTEFPEDCEFPSLFWTVYAHCLLKAGLADHFSVENGDIFVLNALFNVGVISHEYTDYIYANSCRNVVSGMAEWNGGFAYINDDGKLQVDVFSKEVSKTFYSSELMDFDYSDETVVFSKIKTSQKNKTYGMGDDSGYVLVINNQYIGYGLDDADFETYLGFIYDYYKGFSLTPMSFTLAEPDFSLKIGDRISVVDEEENVTVTGNISEITVSGNCSMTVTCGGFGNVSGVVNYNKTSTGQNNQIKAETAQASSAGAVTSYEYLSDLSVKLNGTTYTIEKNAEGLITKITDSSGGELEPTISGEITEIPLHNAALLGAVLARGIGNKSIMPVMDGITGYFEPELCTATYWENRLNASDRVAITGSVTNKKSYTYFPKSSYGKYTTDEPNTIYAIMRCHTDPGIGKWLCSPAVTKAVKSSDPGYGFNLLLHTYTDDVADFFFSGMSAAHDIHFYNDDRLPVDKFEVYAITRNSGTASFFVNGVKAPKTVQVNSGNYSGYYLINHESFSGISLDTPEDIDYCFLAFGSEAHTEEQIIKNSQWLMQKLNGDWNG